MEIKRFFKHEFYRFCCQGRLKHFLKNYKFCRKSGNYTYNRGCRGHVIYIIMTHYVRKSICDSPLTEMIELVELRGTLSNNYDGAFYVYARSIKRIC